MMQNGMRYYYPKKNKNKPNGIWWCEQDILPLSKKVQEVKNNINNKYNGNNNQKDCKVLS